MHGPQDIGWEDDNRVLVDHTHPVDSIEPIRLPGGWSNDDERQGVIRGIAWVCELIGSEGIVAKVLAMRYLLRLESRPMAVVAEAHGMGRAAVSKHLCEYGARFSMHTGKSDKAKLVYAERQRRVWASGKGP